jgi:hypothetical protein
MFYIKSMAYWKASGKVRPIDCLISAEWTPAQAFAVVELLDDLRDRICAHYQTALFELLRDEQSRDSDANPYDPWTEEPPF